jgi:Spy/CpxP family protein refolding chaperone
MRIRWEKKLALAVAAGALALAPALARPAGGGALPGHGPGGRAGMLAHLAEALGLDAEQRETVRGIVERHRNGSFGESMEAMREAHHVLERVIRDPAATDDEVRETADAFAVLAARAAVERHHMAIEIDAVLTPEQRKKAAELREQWQHRRRGPHHGVEPF